MPYLRTSIFVELVMQGFSASFNRMRVFPIQLVMFLWILTNFNKEFVKIIRKSLIQPILFRLRSMNIWFFLMENFGIIHFVSNSIPLPMTNVKGMKNVTIIGFIRAISLWLHRSTYQLNFNRVISVMTGGRGQMKEKIENILSEIRTIFVSNQTVSLEVDFGHSGFQ